MIPRHEWLFLGLLPFVLIGCAEPSQNLPPVVELKWQNKHSQQASHRVERGDTLYSIAFRYDKDYRFLASYNHLASPYTLRPGQIIYLQYLRELPNRYYAPVENGNKANRAAYRANRAQAVTVKRGLKRVPSQGPIVPKRGSLKPSNRPHPQFYLSHRWIWPVKGRVVTNFFPEQGKKGIDIAGQKGKQIVAAAAGQVAYSGSGLSGYGNLIIIKHEGQFLTAYGNNLKNYVKEGQKVKAGTVIAEIGMIGRKFWGVHFEIRKAGQPVNPMRYLP